MTRIYIVPDSALQEHLLVSRVIAPLYQSKRGVRRYCKPMIGSERLLAVMVRDDECDRSAMYQKLDAYLMKKGMVVTDTDRYPAWDRNVDAMLVKHG